MTGLKNPFAVRYGKIILIEDLSGNERGLNCQCVCPACEGTFIARMGEKNTHHFAHSKDPCSEQLAYISGLYRLIHQVLSSGNRFYIPALVVSYTFPQSGILSESNIANHVKIVTEYYSASNKRVVSPGRSIAFKEAEIAYDNKNNIAAIKLTHQGSSMAIKVMPPDTVCKKGTVSAYKDLPTLVLDFSKDEDVIRKSTSIGFQDYLLTGNLVKYWLYNPKIEKAYPEIISLSEIEFRERAKRFAESQNNTDHRYTDQYRSHSQSPNQTYEVWHGNERERDEIGYLDVKDKDFQQTGYIRDRFGKRWIKCIICSKIKRDAHFTIGYAGTGCVNHGRCLKCTAGRKN